MLELTIKEWEILFDINGISIVDELKWNPYALAEGLADDNTEVRLSEVQIGKLSPKDSEFISTLIGKLNVSL